MKPPVKTPVYVSFDYENDKKLKDFIIGQSKLKDSPFSVIDHSIKKEVSGDWEVDAEKRIKKSNIVLVMVGQKTHSAQGVKKEVAIARRHGKKIIQITGYKNGRPKPVKDAGRLRKWSWDNLKNNLR